MARKSEIRAKAKAGLDALLAASSTTDEAEGARHLQEALEHLSDAAGVLPKGKRLREVAKDRKKGKKSAEDTRLQEALTFASGERPDNPVRGKGLLDQLIDPAIVDEYREA